MLVVISSGSEEHNKCMKDAVKKVDNKGWLVPLEMMEQNIYTTSSILHVICKQFVLECKIEMAIYVIFQQLVQ